MIRHDEVYVEFKNIDATIASRLNKELSSGFVRVSAYGEDGVYIRGDNLNYLKQKATASDIYDIVEIGYDEMWDGIGELLNEPEKGPYPMMWTEGFTDHSFIICGHHLRRLIDMFDPDKSKHSY